MLRLIVIFLFAALLVNAMPKPLKQAVGVRLSWQDGQAVDGFLVYQGTTSGIYNVTYKTTSRSLITPSLQPSTRYYFTVVPFSGTNVGPSCPAISVLVPLLSPKQLSVLPTT